MKRIGWGIIGCGAVTEVKSGPGFYKAEGSSLVAVMRRDGAKAADFARRHGVRRWYDDAAALIADKEVDAVYIATPPGTHETYAMQVLAAGKACYVEKPMTRNGAEGRRMVEGFQRKGVPLFVAFYRRRLARFLKVEELLAKGALGRLRRVSYAYGDQRQLKAEVPPHWHVVAEESGGGNFLDMMPHVLDLMDWWFAPLTLMESRAENRKRVYPVEDYVQARMRAWDLPVTLEADFAGETRDEFVIEGEGGEIRLSCFGNEAVRLVRGGVEERIELPYPPHVAMPLIQTIVDELLGRGKCPSTGESGLRTQVVMDAILETYYGGREDGFWKRAWPGTRKLATNEHK